MSIFLCDLVSCVRMLWNIGMKMQSSGHKVFSYDFKSMGHMPRLHMPATAIILRDKIWCIWRICHSFIRIYTTILKQMAKILRGSCSYVKKRKQNERIKTKTFLGTGGFFHRGS